MYDAWRILTPNDAEVSASIWEKEYTVDGNDTCDQKTFAPLSTS